MDIRNIENYSISAGLLIKEIGETTMVYNPCNGDMYELNETGALILSYLQKGAKGAEMLKAICDDYDIDAETVIADVSPIIERFIELGILILS